MLQGKISLQAKKYLRDEQILPELLLDNLSNVPDDILSDTESDSDWDSVTEKKIVQPENITVTAKQAPRKMTVLQMLGQPRGCKKTERQM
jgi:hypothetical protein